MELPIINPGWKVESVVNEFTRFAMREHEQLIVKSKGDESAKIVDIAVPAGKKWIVHFNIEIHECPKEPT